MNTNIGNFYINSYPKNISKNFIKNSTNVASSDNVSFCGSGKKIYIEVYGKKVNFVQIEKNGSRMIMPAKIYRNGKETLIAPLTCVKNC